MSLDWYRWSTIEDAQSALDYLNNHPALPHVGRNAGTGELATDKCVTNKWCPMVTECTDGKYGFPRVSEAWLDALEIQEEHRQAFLDVYVTGKGGVIEEFDPAWLPVFTVDDIK
jgi:hypothetical protein